jgi:hypothetical protein
VWGSGGPERKGKGEEAVGVELGFGGKAPQSRTCMTVHLNRTASMQWSG